ncbi:MAG: NAD-dependent epimerase/dehydratase family protein [Halohasta sp.]
MHDQRVLVTGGAGFIGSTLANRLAADNDVIVVDDASLGTPGNLSNGVEYVETSVLDDDYPADVDVTFHFAALSSRGMHDTDPQRGCRVNVEGFLNTVERVREHGCETVVYASTSSVYGSRITPSPEDLAVEARTAYEASKLARERYAEYYANHHGMAMAGLRFFSVYQGFGGNEEHKGEYANTIAQFADAIAHGEAPRVFGDGTQTRDFVHVQDVVRACELAADHALSGIYNVGTGERHSFNEMIAALNETLGTAVDPEYIPCPFDDYVHDTCADGATFQEATGWEPTIGFEEGIERVCEPYLEGILESEPRQ